VIFGVVVAKLGFRDLSVLPIRDQQRGRGSAQNMHNLFIVCKLFMLKDCNGGQGGSWT